MIILDAAITTPIRMDDYEYWQTVRLTTSIKRSSEAEEQHKGCLSWSMGENGVLEVTCSPISTGANCHTNKSSSLSISAAGCISRCLAVGNGSAFKPERRSTNQCAAVTAAGAFSI